MGSGFLLIKTFIHKKIIKGNIFVIKAFSLRLYFAYLAIVQDAFILLTPKKLKSNED